MGLTKMFPVDTRKRRTDRPVDPAVGERIRQLREALPGKVTQADIAEKMGVVPQTVGNWEAGSVPRTKYLFDLAKLLNTTPEYILGRPLPFDLSDPFLADVVARAAKARPSDRPRILRLLDAIIEPAGEDDSGAPTR